MKPPSMAAAITAAFGFLDAGIACAAGALWVALVLAVLAAAALVLLWDVRDGDDDIEAMVQVVCRCCSPEDCGSCTCAKYCGVIRCTAGLGAIPPMPPRFADWDTRELTS